MDRRRIIIETGEDIASDAKFKALKEKLDSIDKKLKEPWKMPVILALIGGFITFGNFFFQRFFTNGDIYHNKVVEKVAELRATLNVNYYGKSIEAIDSLDQALEAYCTFDPSEDDEKVIEDKMLQLSALGRHNRYIDPASADTVHRYTEFIAEKIYKVSPRPEKDAMLQLYQQSVILYHAAYSKLNKGLKDLEK